MQNGLKKYVRFNIDNKLISTDSFQYLSVSLDSLLKNLGKDNFKSLSQEFSKNVLDLINLFKTRRCSSEDFLICFFRLEIIQTNFDPISIALVV